MPNTYEKAEEEIIILDQVGMEPVTNKDRLTNAEVKHRQERLAWSTRGQYRLYKAICDNNFAYTMEHKGFKYTMRLARAAISDSLQGIWMATARFVGDFKKHAFGSAYIFWDSVKKEIPPIKLKDDKVDKENDKVAEQKNKVDNNANLSVKEQVAKDLEEFENAKKTLEKHGLRVEKDDS